MFYFFCSLVGQYQVSDHEYTVLLEFLFIHSFIHSRKITCYDGEGIFKELLKEQAHEGSKSAQ
jgi:hypothetical protein